MLRENMFAAWMEPYNPNAKKVMKTLSNFSDFEKIRNRGAVIIIPTIPDTLSIIPRAILGIEGIIPIMGKNCPCDSFL